MADVEELVGRVLSRNSGPTRDVQILPGELSPNVPFDLPIPEHVHLAGSVSMDRHIWVCFDSEEPPGQIEGFYQQALESQGWGRDHRFGGPPADVPRIGADTSDHSRHALAEQAEARRRQFATAKFFNQALSTQLILKTRVAEGVTSVILEIFTFTPIRPWGEVEARRSVSEFVPAMAPPEGAIQLEDTTRVSGGRTTMLAVLETSLPPDKILAHYSEQIAVGAWQERQRGSSDAAAWSSWTRNIKGATYILVWFAVLLATEPPKYRVLVEIDPMGGLHPERPFYGEGTHYTPRIDPAK